MRELRNQKRTKRQRPIIGRTSGHSTCSTRSQFDHVLPPEAHESLANLSVVAIESILADMLGAHRSNVLTLSPGCAQWVVRLFEQLPAIGDENFSTNWADYDESDAGSDYSEEDDLDEANVSNDESDSEDGDDEMNKYTIS